MKYLLTFFLVLSALAGMAQMRKFSPENFEKKLAAFRFSLHPLLENTPFRNNFPYIDNAFAAKITDFLSQNQDEIKKYRTYSLEKFANSGFSFNDYQKDTVYTLTDFLGTEKYPQLQPVVSLLAINPFEFAFNQMQSWIIEYFRSHDKTAIEIGEFFARNALGGVRYQYFRQDESNGLLVFDYYSLAFVCDFESKTNLIKTCTVYVRKK